MTRQTAHEPISMPTLPRLFATTLLASALSFSAQAADTEPLSAYEILQQFNLVVFGNASAQHVHGRAYIGGNVSGGEFVMDGVSSLPASSFAGLTVGGNATNTRVLSGGAYIGGNFSGSVNSGSSYVAGNVSNTHFNDAAYVGGNASGTTFNQSAQVVGNVSNSNLNGPNYVGGTIAGSNRNGTALASLDAAPTQASTATFESSLKSFSQSLSTLADTGSSVIIDGNKATFTAVAGDDGIAVFDLSSLDTQLFSLSEFAFDLNGASLVIFNVDDTDLSFAINFLGGSAQTLGSSAIWNFYAAESLTAYSQFGGAVLAPYATLTNFNDIEGTVVVDTLNQFGQIHQYALTGTSPTFSVPVAPVPEPETYAMLLAGLGLIGVVSRRRQPAPRAMA